MVFDCIICGKESQPRNWVTISTAYGNIYPHSLCISQLLDALRSIRSDKAYPLAAKPVNDALTQAMAIINKARRELGIPEGAEWDGSITGKQGMNALCQADGYSDTDYVAERSYPAPGAVPRWPK